MSPVARVVCVGGAAVDHKYRAQGPLAFGTSNPVSSERRFGGVARNVAENLARLGAAAVLVSAVGDDDHGRDLIAHLSALGVDASPVAILRDHRTAAYVAVLDPNGDLAIGLADMAIFDDLQPASLLAALDARPGPDWMFADCNLPAASLAALIDRARMTGIPLAVDAVSVTKVRRLPRDLTGIGLLVLNRDEAASLSDVLPDDDPCRGAARDPVVGHARGLLARGAARVILTQGDGDLIVADAAGILPVRPCEARLVDATGAGDALIAAAIGALAAGESLAGAARLGARAAALTVESRHSVRPDLSHALLKPHNGRPTRPLGESEVS